MSSKNNLVGRVSMKLWFFLVFVLLLASSMMLSGNAQAVDVGTPFPIATTAGEEASLSAAFDGTNYLIGIQGDANAENRITAQLVSQSGTLVGPRIAVQREQWAATGSAPSVAFDGTNYLVIWADDHWSNENYHPDDYNVQFGQFIGKSGQLVGTPFIIGSTLANACSSRNAGSVIFDGTNYFVVWEKRRLSESADLADLYGQFITPSGNLLGAVIPVSTAAHGQRDPVLSFDGANILVVWTDSRNQNACGPNGEGGTSCYESDIYGQKITKSSESAAGSLSGVNFLISASSLPRDSTAPSIAFDGTNHFIVFAEETTFPGDAPDGIETWHIFGQFVTASGTATGDIISIKTDGNYILPTVTYDQGKHLVVWNDATDWNIYGQLMSTSGVKIGSEIIIDDSVGTQLGGCRGPAANGKLFCFIDKGFDFEIDQWGDVYGLFLNTSAVLYAKFSGLGIWQYSGTGTDWTQVTASNPDLLVTVGADLYGTFPGMGIWKYNGSAWDQTTTSVPEEIVGTATTLYGTFTGLGIWEWNGSAWSQTTSSIPQSIIASTSDLYGTFAGLGIWKWNGTTWSNLTTSIPDILVTSGVKLYGTFPGAGIWLWNGTEWAQATPNTPQMIAGNSTILYGAFEGAGIWSWAGSDWTQISTDTPTQMTASEDALYAVFTGVGIRKWDGSAWTTISTGEPAGMVVGN